MEVIRILDEIDLTKNEQTVRLQLYDSITLYNILPTDLANIVRKYAEDNVVIKSDIDYNNNKYFVITEELYAFTYSYVFFQTPQVYGIRNFVSKSFTTERISNYDASYPISSLINKYMGYMCVDNTKIYNTCYAFDDCNVTYEDNTLTCTINNFVSLQICINDHDLFRQQILIMCHINKKIDNALSLLQT